jgi:hypothetical protein
MGFIGLLFPWGVVLQVLAIVHFIRRRPDGIWLFVIIFLGPIGALVYIGLEVLPDLALLRQSFESVGRRKRMQRLEAIVLQNPSPGNYEELADLHLEAGSYHRARECYDKAITSRADSLDAVYRRGVAAIHLADFGAAITDLEQVVARDRKYDFHRAVGLLAHACANTGRTADADALFQEATGSSTSSETYLNYATFLAAQGRTAEAREWAQRILDKKPAMPRYIQRRDRAWFRRARSVLKKL